jgi:hypothetical protein
VTRLGKFAHWVIVFFGLIEKKYIWSDYFHGTTIY